jgi:large subunit ribosomal protein L19
MSVCWKELKTMQHLIEEITKEQLRSDLPARGLSVVEAV